MIYRREAHNLYAKREAEGQYVLHVPGVVFCVPSVLDEKSACLKDAMECHGGIGDSRIAASSLKAAKMQYQHRLLLDLSLFPRRPTVSAM